MCLVQVLPPWYPELSSHFSQFRPSILVEHSRILVGSAYCGFFTYKFKISRYGEQRECSLLRTSNRESPMAGNGRQKKFSFFSIFSIFKAFCSPGGDDTSDEEGNYRRRICPSNDDRDGWLAEPGIDRKASDFIARFYASRVSDSQTCAV